MPKDLHMYIYVLIFFYHSVLPLVQVPAYSLTNLYIVQKIFFLAIIERGGSGL
jgi:hypothetical protein